MNKQEFESKTIVVAEKIRSELNDMVSPEIADEQKILSDAEAGLASVNEQAAKHQAAVRAEQSDIAKLEQEVRVKLQSGDDISKERKKLAELKSVVGLNTLTDVIDGTEKDLKEQVDKAKHALALEGQRMFSQNLETSVSNIYSGKIAAKFEEIVILLEVFKTTVHQFVAENRLVYNGVGVEPTQFQFMRKTFKMLGDGIIARKLQGFMDPNQWPRTMQYALRDLKDAANPQAPAPTRQEKERNTAVALVTDSVKRGSYAYGAEHGMKDRDFSFQNREQMEDFASKHLGSDWAVKEPKILALIDKKVPAKSKKKKEGATLLSG